MMIVIDNIPNILNRSLVNYFLILWIILTQLNSTNSCLRSYKSNMYQKMDPEQIQPTSSKFYQYSQYLRDKYDSRISADEINLIFYKWKEFKNSYRENDGDVEIDNFDKVKNVESGQNKIENNYISNKPPPSLAELQEIIKNREDSNLILNVNFHQKKKLKNGKGVRNRIFSKFEANKALNVTSYFDDPKTGACQPQKRSFCMKDYFSIHEKDHDLHFFYPPSFTVNRCSQETCQCSQQSHECAPVKVKSTEHYMIGVDNQSLPWTWAFYITDHLACQCKSRCFKRKCIKPFLLKYNLEKSDACSCACPAGKEHRCNAILTGKSKFSTSDYFCIMSGKCLKPKCLLGELSEENLYHRMCPR